MIRPFTFLSHHQISQSAAPAATTASIIFAATSRLDCAVTSTVRRSALLITQRQGRRYSGRRSTEPRPGLVGCLSGPPRRRSFSTTRRCLADHRNAGGKTHYEILGISPSATPVEIKKSFYALSRSTHPDIHPNDPTASSRFSQISESYHTLSDPEKRRRYDRDVIAPLYQHQAGSHHGGVGVGPRSYAGSRPASGLSKRRGTFRGPPPSFYAQGGYGSTTSQRASAEHGAETSGPSSAFSGGSRSDPSSYASRPNESNRSNSNPYSTGPNPFSASSSSSSYGSNGSPNPASEFQTAEDTRRLNRRQQELAAAHRDMRHGQNFWIQVVVVMAIFIGAGVLAGGIRVKQGQQGRKDEVRGFGGVAVGGGGDGEMGKMKDER